MNNGIGLEPNHERRGLWLEPNHGRRGLWLQMESIAMFGGRGFIPVKTDGLQIDSSADGVDRLSRGAWRTICMCCRRRASPPILAAS
jgi:hypothetical protein